MPVVIVLACPSLVTSRGEGVSGFGESAAGGLLFGIGSGVNGACAYATMARMVDGVLIVPIKEFKASLDMNALFGEPGYTTRERIWARPTLEINGIWGGFQGEGSKTVIPSKAGAKLSCRLVPNQDPNKIFKLLKEHILALAPGEVRVEIIEHHHGEAMVMDLSSPYFEAAGVAMEKAFGRKPIFIRAGGSIPIALTLKSVLGCDIIFLELGLNEDGLHSPNESFALEDYRQGILASAYFFEEVSKLKPTEKSALHT